MDTRKQVQLVSLLLLLPTAPVLAFTNGQAASFVLGQPNFTSNLPGASQNSVNGTGQSVYDPTLQRLFVSDSNNHRVLVFDLSSGIWNGMNASYVIGQPDFASNLPTPALPGDPATANAFADPGSMVYDDSTKSLFVADSSNSRILVFDLSGGILPSMSAIHVIGQPDMATHSPRLDRFGFQTVGAMALDSVDHRLFVGDSAHNRVLVFDISSGVSDFMPAFHVLGQIDFISQGARLDKSGFTSVGGLAYDPNNSHLFVADGSNRILIFHLAGGISDNMNAVNVIGQTDFFSNSPGTTANTLNGPSKLSYDPVSYRLFAGDTLNNRVLIYQVNNGIVDGMPASVVLGQLDFVTKGPALTANGFVNPMPEYDPSEGQLFVGDALNNRLLVFTPPGCGGLIICGKLSAIENPTINLPGISLDLRDSRGALLRTEKTDSAGTYRFNGLALHKSYYVVPALGRTQSSIPLQGPVPSLPINGSVADFLIRGWPATLLSNDAPPGSVILASTFSYSGAGSSDPPVMSPGEHKSYYVTTTAGVDGQANLSVAPGSYYISCWKAQKSTAPGSYPTLSFIRSPSVGSNGPYPVLPNQTANFSCL